jgi:hypothetical protein
MKMTDFPVITIELSSLRRRVAHAFININDELNQRVIESIEKQITEEWVLAEIDKSVKECMKSAIEAVATDFRMRNVMTDLVINTISKKLRKDEA